VRAKPFELWCRHALRTMSTYVSIALLISVASFATSEALATEDSVRKPVPASSAKVFVDAVPHGLVWLDGTLRGKTRCEIDAMPGKHIIVVTYYLSSSEKRTKTIKREFNAGDQRLISVDFKSEGYPVSEVDLRNPSPAQ
jgi:hypothetical protein